VAIGKEFLAVILSMTLVLATWPLESCTKPEQKAALTGEIAPTATAAVPTSDELYQLVAPIALFPDNLVAQVLAGSTYPDQIDLANTWLQQNSNLKGDQLMQAADQQSWDSSVKALTQFPDVLNQMATNLSWTSALGDAYFNVPQSVMNAVQVMRQRASQAGNLKTNQQQNVTVQSQAPGAKPAPASSGSPQVIVVQAPPQTIVIQPAQPQVVYVPTYNPAVVYGAPVPVYPGYTNPALATAITFGVGIAVGMAMSNNHCCGWGWNSWGCSWHSSTVVYNRNVYVSTSNTFVNRNNYYNRNVNNVNINKVNVNNVNRNNVNVNNVNRNNVNNNNYRTNNFKSTSQYSAPTFNQKNNQPQFNNNQGKPAQNNRQQPSGANQPNLNQQNRNNQGQPAQNGRQQPSGANQSNLNQQNRAATNQNQSRPGNVNQAQRNPARGYGQQADKGTSSGAFSNYSPGGNARTNSARGAQSLEGNRAGASKPQPSTTTRKPAGRAR